MLPIWVYSHLLFECDLSGLPVGVSKPGLPQHNAVDLTKSTTRDKDYSVYG
jgi:hypothetical protein